jgi:predicted RNA-binding Zn ribbon-like protein
MMVSVTTNSAPRSYTTEPPKLIAGALCLDFVNTLTWRGDPAEGDERLHHYDQLIYWARHAGAIGQRDARALLGEARCRPQDARRVLESALALREAIARLVLARGRGPSADVALLNRLLAEAPRRTSVMRTSDGFAWSTEGEPERLDQPLWPVAWSAADLLVSERLADVQTCADRRCGWMFLDVSRSRRRRWCSMEDCGNRAKVRRHYERAKRGR